MPDSACIVQKRAHRGQEHPQHVPCAHLCLEVEALVGLVDYPVYKTRPRQLAIDGAPPAYPFHTSTHVGNLDSADGCGRLAKVDNHPFGAHVPQLNIMPLAFDEPRSRSLLLRSAFVRWPHETRIPFALWCLLRNWYCVD